MQVNGGPITECPVCRYSLDGLPRNYHCPECGFEYEETMRVWVARTSRIFKILLFGVGPVLGVICVIIFLYHGKRAPVFLLLQLSFQSLIFAFLYRNKMSGFVVVGAKGITFKCGRRPTVLRPWTDVQFRDSIWFSDIVTGSPSLPRYLPLQFIKAADRTELKDEIVRRLRTFYVSSPPSTSSAPHSNDYT